LRLPGDGPQRRWTGEAAFAASRPGGLKASKDARPDDANPRVLWHDRRDTKKLADSFEQFVSSLRPLS